MHYFHCLKNVFWQYTSATDMVWIDTVCCDKYSSLRIVIHSGSSQTYNANEIELLLLTDDKGQTVEWIEIDPEAFTGQTL